MNIYTNGFFGPILRPVIWFIYKEYESHTGCPLRSVHGRSGAGIKCFAARKCKVFVQNVSRKTLARYPRKSVLPGAIVAYDERNLN